MTEDRDLQRGQAIDPFRGWQNASQSLVVVISALMMLGLSAYLCIGLELPPMYTLQSGLSSVKFQPKRFYQVPCKYQPKSWVQRLLHGAHLVPVDRALLGA